MHEAVMIENHPLLVMSVLGPNLRTLKDKHGGSLSDLTCLQIMH